MPTDYIRYDLLVQEALRSVVRKVLGDAARNGLPGEHHFNIAFKTQAPGVVIPPAVLQRYPDEMAIILQHEFWDLEVTNDAFEVSLNFSRKPERLTIPFDSITGFSDPVGSLRLQARAARRDASPPRRRRRRARPRASRIRAPPPRRRPPRRRRPSAAAVRQVGRASGEEGRAAARSRAGEGRLDRRVPQQEVN